MEFVAATNNAHKLVELRAIFEASGHSLASLSDSGFSGEIIEDGDTFAANALIKARTVCRATGMPAIADDSGLCVDSLGGEPGVYSARYGAPECVTDADRRQLLLRNMESITERGAHFACAIACVFPNGDELLSEGKCFGEITRDERGDGGFGYDCIFMLRGRGLTLSEISAEEKNEVSHRAAAMADFVEKLDEYFSTKENS